MSYCCFRIHSGRHHVDNANQRRKRSDNVNRESSIHISGYIRSIVIDFGVSVLQLPRVERVSVLTAQNVDKHKYLYNIVHVFLCFKGRKTIYQTTV